METGAFYVQRLCSAKPEGPFPEVWNTSQTSESSLCRDHVNIHFIILVFVYGLHTFNTAHKYCLTAMWEDYFTLSLRVPEGRQEAPCMCRQTQRSVRGGWRGKGRTRQGSRTVTKVEGMGWGRTDWIHKRGSSAAVEGAKS